MHSKICLLPIFFLSFITNIHGQEKLFSYNGILTADAKNIITKGTKLKLNRAVLKNLYATQPAEIRIEISIEHEIVIIDLKKKKLFSKNFEVIVSGTLETFDYTPGYYLQGKIEGEEHSLAAISIFNDFAGGIISYNGSNYDLAIANNTNDHADDDYIIYADKDNLAPRPNCFTKDDNNPVIANKSVQPSSLAVGCPIDMYFETGYSIFNNFSSVQNVMNYLTILFNGDQALYSNESITIQIRQVKVWTTPDPEAIYSNMVIALGSFAARMSVSGFNGDIAQLVTFVDYGGGAAILDNLCLDAYGRSTVCGNLVPNYSPYPNYSFSVTVMAHETGHTIGSPHTHSCTWPGGPIDNCVPVDNGPCTTGPAPSGGGTIMSYCHLTGYGINFANGFGPLPGTLIRSKVSAAATTGCTCNCNNMQVDISKQDKNCNHNGSANAIVTNGTGPFSYLWSNGATGPSVTGLAGGVYYVTVTSSSSSNCKIIKGVKILDSSVNVTLNPSAASVVKCTGQGYSLSASVSPVYTTYTYQWYENNMAVPGATSSSITITSPVNATLVYYVIATGGGCTLQSPVKTIVFVDIPIPVVTVNGTPNICDGQSVLLSTSSTSFFTEWELNNTTIAGATGSTLSVSGPGSYSVKNYYPSSAGCSKTSVPVNIILLPLPNASVNTTNIDICFGEYAMITHPPLTGETYQWYRNNVLIPGGTNSYLDVNTGGNYFLKVFGANGCSNTSAIVLVTVNPLPDVTLNPKDTIALCDGGALPLHAVPFSQAQYTWYHESQQLSAGSNSSIQITQGGSYSVTIINTITGCTNSSDSTFVTTYPPPAISACNDTLIAIGQPYTMNVHAATLVPVDHFEWTPSTGLNNPYSSHPTTTLTHDQEYMVKGFYPSGCFATDKVLIKVLKGPAFYIPSAFSPNDDTRNDILKCIAVGIKTFRYFDIYNRYGQRVFHSTSLLTPWDGKWNGRKSDVGTYVYMVEGVDFSGKTVFAKGTITIIL